MKLYLEEKALALIFTIMLLLVALVGFVSNKNTTELVLSANKVQSTYEILNTVTNFYAAMTVAESGRRGYVFSGSEKELKRYQLAIVDMQSELNKLLLQTTNNLEIHKLIKELNFLALQRIELLKKSISLYQTDISAVAFQIYITERSVQLRERIQKVLSEIKEKEKQQLNISLNQSRSSIQYRVMIEQIGTTLSFLIIAGVLIVFYQEKNRRQKLQDLEKQLLQAKELSELKLRLFSMISHEFRTPLSIILASSQLLEEILEPLITQKDFKNLYRIQTSAKLMNKLLTDILTLTRAEVGTLEFNPVLLDVEAFCLNLLEDIQSFTITQRLINFSTEGYCGRVYLDEKLLYSILSNLLLNAIKYSPEGSKIDFYLKCEPNRTIFIVEDEGIGISKEEQEKLFQPFFRGKNVERISGSGLGLPVVQICVQLHKGTIDLKSEVGKGTTFIVEIPKSDKIS